MKFINFHAYYLAIKIKDLSLVKIFNNIIFILTFSSLLGIFVFFSLKLRTRTEDLLRWILEHLQSPKTLIAKLPPPLYLVNNSITRVSHPPSLLLLDFKAHRAHCAITHTRLNRINLKHPSFIRHSDLHRPNQTRIQLNQSSFPCFPGH